MRAIWFGLFGLAFGLFAMNAMLTMQTFHIDTPIRLIVSVVAGVVCGVFGYVAARSQRAR